MGTRIAKVTQEEADAYGDGWAARFRGHPQNLPEDKHLAACYVDGWNDCAKGELDFWRYMGPKDLEPEGP